MPIRLGALARADALAAEPLEAVWAAVIRADATLHVAGELQADVGSALAGRHAGAGVPQTHIHTALPLTLHPVAEPVDVLLGRLRGGRDGRLNARRQQRV